MGDNSLVYRSTGTHFQGNPNNDLETIAKRMKSAVEGADDAVAKALEKINTPAGTDAASNDGGNINAAELANVQMAMNKWSISYSLTASTSRTVKDMMSGIIQKI